MPLLAGVDPVLSRCLAGVKWYWSGIYTTGFFVYCAFMRNIVSIGLAVTVY
jgi:hypothetical protein